MNKKQLSHFEKRLLEERARVIKELGHYDESFSSTLQGADGNLSSYSFHMADQGTDAMEREKQFLFASQEGRYLWHVNEALRRLYQSPDKFGRCHESTLHQVQGERGRWQAAVVGGCSGWSPERWWCWISSPSWLLPPTCPAYPDRS
jgi:RNA polymerase-binding transcription factor DksA